MLECHHFLRLQNLRSYYFQFQHYLGLNLLIVMFHLLGETDHYHYISQAVTDGIMSLTIELDSDYPKIIFGVLTCQSKELAIARSNSNMDKNKGYEAGKAALKMISTKKY